MAVREVEIETEVKRAERIAKRRAVWEKTGGHCAYCGVAMTSKTFTIDHIHPRASGGSDDLDNLLPACANCNGMKGDRPLEDLRVKLRFKLAGMPAFSDTQIAWIKEYLNADIEPGTQRFYFERPLRRDRDGEGHRDGLRAGD